MYNFFIKWKTSETIICLSTKIRYAAEWYVVFIFSTAVVLRRIFWPDKWQLIRHIGRPDKCSRNHKGYWQNAQTALACNSVSQKQKLTLTTKTITLFAALKAAGAVSQVGRQQALISYIHRAVLLPTTQRNYKKSKLKIPQGAICGIFYGAQVEVQ